MVDFPAKIMLGLGGENLFFLLRDDSIKESQVLILEIRRLLNKKT